MKSFKLNFRKYLKNCINIHAHDVQIHYRKQKNFYRQSHSYNCCTPYNIMQKEFITDKLLLGIWINWIDFSAMYWIVL